MGNPLIIITGPTSVGKTSLSIELAKRIDGEIISADSMQVYKYMDIGTAKASSQQMDGVRHHLIDCILPNEDFNVYRFKKMAKACIEDIYSRGKVPIIAGGTGFYIQAVLYDIDFNEDNEITKLRKELEEMCDSKGRGYLHDMLRSVDKISADKIHENDVKRVIRAIEYNMVTGKKLSEHNEEERQKTSNYDFKYFVLNMPRNELYERIDKRVDIMIEQGLVEEVNHLMKMGYNRDLISMKGLGYKEIIAFLSKECSLEEAIYTIKRDTRHFAKRQLTWFKRERDVVFVNRDEFDYDDNKILDYIFEQSLEVVRRSIKEDYE